ncbi:hypothetical protein X943_003461 [Babesia divergens]|uniref:PUL domain-containing protein n=1 Tax=Babesia divergens TaxID=32595 RepID=A0AAD9LJN2_BABDI|nr:hypothetical protein X943_003461 [Babesia divergens]
MGPHTSLSCSDLTFVFKLIQWPAVERVPVFDFLKVLLLDPGCTTLYKGRNSGIQIYNCVCATLTDVEGNAPLATVSLQLLANMFVLTLPRNIALAHFDRTIQAINDGGAICQKMVQQAHSVCIENLIIACSDRTKDRSEKILGCLQSALYTLRRTKDAESWLGSVMLRHCRSLETLVYFDNKVPALLRKLGLLQMILDVAAEILPMKERRMVEESVDKLSQRIS